MKHVLFNNKCNVKKTIEEETKQAYTNELERVNETERNENLQTRMNEIDNIFA